MITPLVTFPVKGQSKPLTFSTIEELDTWIVQEQAFWSWLQPLNPPDNSLHVLWAEMNSLFSQIRSHIQSYQSNTNESHRSNVLNTISHSLTDLYNTPKTVLSSSAAAKFVQILRERSPYVAAYALYGILEKHPLQKVGNPASIRGIALAEMFERGISNDTAEAYQAALRTAADNWNTFHESSERTHKEQQEAFSALTTKLNIWRSEQQKKYEAMMEAAQNDFDKIAKDGKDRFEQIHDTYNEQLGLQAPVKYWEDRAKSYLWTSVYLSIASALVAMASGIAVWFEIQQLVTPYVDGISQPDGSQGWQFGVHAWRYAFVIASAAFFVWPIRILVRLLLSAIHLRTDSLERATLAKTYLSLLSRKEGLDQNDRRLILEVLFRPSSTGIVADDAAPASMIHVLSRLGAGDKR